MGFELFGFRVQVCSQLVQFTLAHKGFDNHHCHNKSQTGNVAGVWMMSYPEEMGWEFGRFWKRFSWVPTSWVGARPGSWEFEIGPCRQTIELLPLGLGMEFSTVATAIKFFKSQPAKMNWDLKHHEMCRTLGVLLAEYDYERLLRIVSLSLCLRTKVRS